MSLLTVSEPQLPISATDPTALPVISLEGVSVRYLVPKERIGTFKEYVIRWVQRKISHYYYWALKDVTLEVRPGEVFGLIGKNGAGKSTILKLVARVLRPTIGRVVVRGHVAPLLEVGAGFHGELTGRENVFLNGAMLGFSHAEMQEKFSRIVKFAELEDFIDAPMRTYSTGMWARLGFAIATDVEPDVLIIDEVLSVGDEAFQRKSLARIHNIREKGTTILFVSHNMASIMEMCHRAAWLDDGRIEAIGEPGEVIEIYRRSQPK